MNEIFILKNKYNFFRRYPFCLKKDFLKVLEIISEKLSIKRDLHVSLISLNNEEISKLSLQYKKIKKPTDILSFPSDYLKLEKMLNYWMIGDIYISFEKVLEQAKAKKWKLKKEWLFLFIHGVLHLLGFDHKNKSDFKKMEKTEKEIMQELNFK